MASSDNTTPPAQKSKQERIRDNQRRSRARRQEYLADLERRLSDCHVSCREAELQRSAFQELQTENARLRELLTLAGVSHELIDSFVHQNNSDSNHQPDPASSLRHLKPKISAMEPNKSQMAPANPIPTSCASSSASGLVQSMPVHNNYPPNSHYQYTATQQPPVPPPYNYEATAQTTTFGWLFDPDTTIKAEDPNSPFCCDTFNIAPTGQLLPNDENAVLCSVAKDMIAQYNVTPQEMEQIRMRLSTGFSKPSFPGEGCRVNQQLLFQVLNEVNARYS